MVWAAANEPRLPNNVRELLASGDAQLSVSAVIAWEFEDLRLRGRLPAAMQFSDLVADLGIRVLDLPADTWTVANSLPPLHKDPIDRMMVAHAILADLTIVTSDAVMRRYPVKSFW